jgi:hypothetical protein
MKLATLEKYVALVYAPGSAPSLSTLRRRIRKSEVPGGVLDMGRYYVDLDASDKVRQVASDLEVFRAKSKKNPNLAGLI